MMKRLGRIDRCDNSYEVADSYGTIAMQNEMAAQVLATNGFYNEAGYMYIQSMEKLLKEHIFKKVNIENKYYADKMREIGHSVDKAADFYVELCTGNKHAIREDIMQQLNAHVFQDINFSYLHNKLRYPEYNARNHSYENIVFTAGDCAKLRETLNSLKTYINEIEKMTLIIR